MFPKLLLLYNTLCLSVKFMPRAGRSKEERSQQDIDDRIFALEEQVRVLTNFILEAHKDIPEIYNDTPEGGRHN